MLDEELIDYLIFHGREERNLEYKRAMNWDEIETKIKVTQAAMAMANISDGGYIVIGVTKQGETYIPDGMKKGDFDSFNQDDVMTWVNEYADPYVELTVVYAERDSKNFVIIEIMEFDQLPIVCRKPGQDLKRGDMFTRSRRKYETVRVSSQNEMREILELAVDKENTRLNRRGYKTREETIYPVQDDKKLFEQQGEEFCSKRGLLQKIKTKGYWKVEIRPTKFEKLRIPTMSKAQEVVQSCIVTLSGWDYPHWNNRNVKNMQDWVESWEDWEEYIECWRFYRSGKFIHSFALHEDYIDMEKALPERYPPRPKRAGYLGFFSVVYRVTEVFEFAARLASKGMLNPGAFVSIGLHNVKDHQLIGFDAGMSLVLRDDYVYTTDGPIVIEKEIPEGDLIDKSDESAVNYMIELFELFQWNNPSRQILGEAQKKLRKFRTK